MLFAAVAASAVSARAARDQEEKPSIYLVLVHGEPLAAAIQRGVDRNATWHRAQKRRVARFHDRLLRRAAVDEGGGSYHCRKIYSFQRPVNGFAIHATASLAERLRAAPEVAAVEEDVGTRLMTTYMPRLLGLPNGVWRRHWVGGGGDDGEGVLIGFVDSGIDPAHPSFA